MKQLAKKAFSLAGLRIEKRDRIAEQIPANYLRSQLLPPIYRDSLRRIIYFHEMFRLVAGTPGDIVECGVSIGTGILNWALLSELSGRVGQIVGFDSFAGFPPTAAADRKSDGSFQTAAGEYASPPELVIRILRDGRVSELFVRDHIRLVRGYFTETLPHYSGAIALLHLDCDLYESYRECLANLYHRVVPGGLIMFDEYEDASFPGARKAVDEFFAGKPESLLRYDGYGYTKFYAVKC